MDEVEKYALTCSEICCLLLLCTEEKGNGSIDTDTKADGDRGDDILRGKHKREGCHGILTDFSYKITVNNVVKRIHQHG